ncbi:MAG: helix-turn-helix domain-containing protein [Candidatus Dormibacteria bacterium]
MPLACTYRELFGACEPELLARDELAAERATIEGKVARVVDLILLLAHTEEGFCETEIAAELGIGVRTVQRYLQLLGNTRLDLVGRKDARTYWRVRL